MRVEFSPEIFASDGLLSPSVTLPPIIKIMACAVDGRHDWSADPPTLEVAAWYFESHAPTMGPTYLELGRKGLVDAAWRPPFNTALVYVTLSDLADVAEDICRSAVLVVEDLYSDGCFIRALAEVFRADHVLKALSAGWLEIRHGGGEQLPPVAEAARCTFRRAVCVVALLDSDRLLPDQRTKAHDKAK